MRSSRVGGGPSHAAYSVVDALRRLPCTKMLRSLSIAGLCETKCLCPRHDRVLASLPALEMLEASARGVTSDCFFLTRGTNAALCHDGRDLTIH